MSVYYVSITEDVYHVSVGEDCYRLVTQTEETLDVKNVEYVYHVSVVMSGSVSTDVTVPVGGSDVPEYFIIDATNVGTGYISLSGSGGSWNTSKAIIKQINVYTDCLDWDMSLLTDSSGGAIPDYPIMEQGYGSERIFLDLPYEDEAATDSVHLYLTDNIGGSTFSIAILGTELA